MNRTAFALVASLALASAANASGYQSSYCAPKYYYKKYTDCYGRCSYKKVYYCPKKKAEVIVVEKERDVPVSYLATLIPSNTYSYNITTPPAPTVQQAALTATFGVAQSSAAAFGQQQAIYQQQAYAPQAGYPGAYAPQPPMLPPPPYGQPQQQAPQQQMPASPQDRLDKIEADVAATKLAFQQLCKTLNVNPNGDTSPQKQQQPNGNGNQGNGNNGNGNGGNGSTSHPKFFDSVCAKCHNVSVSAEKGGNFGFWDRGQLADFSDRDIQKMETHYKAGTMPPEEGETNPTGIKMTQQQNAAWHRWILSEKKTRGMP